MNFNKLYGAILICVIPVDKQFLYSQYVYCLYRKTESKWDGRSLRINEQRIDGKTSKPRNSVGNVTDFPPYLLYFLIEKLFSVIF